MQETPPKRNQMDASDHATDEVYGLSTAMLREIIHTLDEEDGSRIHDLVLALHAADAAELLNSLGSDRREKLLRVIGEEIDPDILPYLDPDVRDEVVETLGAKKAAFAITQLDTDDAIHVIGDLDEEEQQEILREIPEEYRFDLEEGLSYPDSSAGRLMRKKLVAIPEYWTVGDTIDYLRGPADLPDDFYALFVVDPKFNPRGELLLSRVMQNKRDVFVKDIMNTELRQLPIDMDQEEVAHIFRKYGLVEAPVVNVEGRLVGVVTVDDVVDVMQEEGEEDFMRLGGVTQQDFHANLLQTVKTRLPWLVVNLTIASISAQVINAFDTEIQRLIILAVLMPIIASIGGNAGIQAVTVAIRALAMRELKETNMMDLIRKEMSIGLLNGIMLAAVSALVIAVCYGDVALALVFGSALMVNLLMAGLAGALIPIALSRMKLDPAIASGVFLTMLTDITGFFSFLGLASIFLL